MTDISCTWTNPGSLDEIEAAISAGHLFVSAGNGRWHQARRNGRTQRWVRTPEAFRLPIKYSFRNYAAITHHIDPAWLRIAASREAAKGRGGHS